MIRSTSSSRLLALAIAFALAAGCAPDTRDDDSPRPRWFRGNTHTHTLWSDGDGAPELVVSDYLAQGYDFLVLSDHDVLADHERWIDVTPQGALTIRRVEELEQRFGRERVRLRTVGGQTQMRLATLAELRARFERAGDFILVTGEEVTDAFEGAPVHVNGVNLVERVEPQGGVSLVDVLENDVGAILAQGRREGRAVLAHLNHPNYGWAFDAQTLASVRDARFFEVYNGHRGVHNDGDAEHPSTERLWDEALVARLHVLDHDLLYGIASDDTHHAHGTPDVARPFRGWVMVRADMLDADALVSAMHAGDFYATSGVVLDDVRCDGRRLVVDVADAPGERHVVRFVGTRLLDGEPATIGEVLLETTADPAEYVFTGDELYVRAVVVSSRLHPDPYATGDFETAWVQPVRPDFRVETASAPDR